MVIEILVIMLWTHSDTSARVQQPPNFDGKNPNIHLTINANGTQFMHMEKFLLKLSDKDQMRNQSKKQNKRKCNKKNNKHSSDEINRKVLYRRRSIEN